MKVVREHINEKFTEEGDPVRDMGIGIDKMIDDYRKKVAKDRGWTGRDNVNNITAASNMVQDMSASGWHNKALTEEEFDQHLIMLEHLLKKGVDVNGSGTYFLSNALHIKFPKKGRMEVLKLLIKYGLKLKTIEDLIYGDENDTEKTKALILLAEVGLQQRKEKFQQTWKNNVLKWASDHKNTDLIKWAINKGADTSNRDHFALQKALENNNVELIKLLVGALLKEPEYK